MPFPLGPPDSTLLPPFLDLQEFSGRFSGPTWSKTTWKIGGSMVIYVYILQYIYIWYIKYIYNFEYILYIYTNVYI